MIASPSGHLGRAAVRVSRAVRKVIISFSRRVPKLWRYDLKSS